MRFLIPVVFFCGLGMLGLIPEVGSDPAEDDDTRVRMLGIYQAVRVTFLFGLDEEEFSAAENRDQILGALDIITANSRQLVEHGSDPSAAFRLIGEALSADASRALQRFEARDHDGARFFLNKLTEYCFACHTRLPSQQNANFAADFLQEAEGRGLSAEQQMVLCVATRQFERGLEVGEEWFEAPGTDARQIDLSGGLEDYLKIALRVCGDLKRPSQTLDRFAGRDDVPEYLGAYIEEWTRTLRQISPRDLEKDLLGSARGLVQHGNVKNEYPADRRGLVHFLMASSLLHRYIQARPQTPEGLAEAYYLLGVCEDHITLTSWLPETEFYLESAIRAAPDTEVARKAYLFLEEYLIRGYSGSRGVDVPPEIRERLDELRGLLEES